MVSKYRVCEYGSCLVLDSSFALAIDDKILISIDRIGELINFMGMRGV